MAVQHLVFLRRLVVVIAVACQFVQHDSANVGVGIPGVVGLHALVAAGVEFLAQQTVVFDVVDALEEQEGDDPCAKGTQHDVPGEQEPHGPQISRLNEVVPEHVVLGREERQLLALEQLGLKSPGVEILLGHRRPPEAIHRLVVAGRGAIFWRGHVHVVAKVVLDEEVHVQAGHVQQFAHQPLRQGGAVSQFVGDVDRIGRKQNAGRQEQTHQFKCGVGVALQLEKEVGHQPKYKGHVGVQHQIEHPHAVLLLRRFTVEVRGAFASENVENGKEDERIKDGGIGPNPGRFKGHIRRQGHGVGEQVFEVFHVLKS